MPDDATILLKGDRTQLASELKRGEQDVNNWGAGVKKMLIGLGAFMAARKLFDIGKGFLDSALEVEKIEAKLEARLKATGEAAGQSKQMILDRSEALKKLADGGDDTVTAMQTMLLTFKNIKGDQFNLATKASLDLAAAMGTDAVSAASQLGRALERPGEGMRILRMAGVSFTKEQTKAIKAMQEAGDAAGAQKVILDALAGTIGGTAEKMANTAGGKMRQFKDRMGDIGEAIGAKLIPIVEKLMPVFEAVASFIESSVVPAVTGLVDWWMKLSQSIGESVRPGAEALQEVFATLAGIIMDDILPALAGWYEFVIRAGAAVATLLMPIVQGLAEFLAEVVVPAIKFVVGVLGDWAAAIYEVIKPALDFLLDGVVYIFTGIQNILQNFADTCEMVGLVFALAFVKAFETVKHWLVDVIPPYFSWLGRNWRAILTDMLNALKSIGGNIGANFKNLWGSIKSFFKGGGWDFEWTPLLEGFETTMEKLPEIAQRVKSETELSLEKQLDKVTDRLGQSFEANLRKNTAAVNRALGRNVAEVANAAGAGGGANANPEQPGTPAYYVRERANRDRIKGTGGGDNGEKSEFSSGIEDLLSLSSRVTAAAAGRADPQAKVVGAVEHAANARHKQAEQHHKEIKLIVHGLGALT